MSNFLSGISCVVNTDVTPVLPLPPRVSSLSSFGSNKHNMPSLYSQADIKYQASLHSIAVDHFPANRRQRVWYDRCEQPPWDGMRHMTRVHISGQPEAKIIVNASSLWRRILTNRACRIFSIKTQTFIHPALLYELNQTFVGDKPCLIFSD